jgi:predicted MPP superfamily phosphohydrolase
MSSLKAKDGVLSVMGNHDYCSYSGFSPARQAEEIQRTRNVHRSFGWKMLENEHFYLHRDSDSILVVGEENWGLKPFPQVGNIKKALKGVTIDPTTKTTNTFSLCLSHDPNAWKHHIMPLFIPNITLAGHTHGAQFSIFGWHPIQYAYDEWGGEYYVPMKKHSKAMLSVSTGFGGNLPFRFGMPREVVVITLKRTK